MHDTTHKPKRPARTQHGLHKRHADRPPTGGQAVSYLRVASVSQTDDGSRELADLLAIQRHACQATARRRKAEIVAEFIDYGSATSPLVYRRGLRQLLARLEAGNITDVIVHTPDRLERNHDSYLTLAAQLDASGAQLVFADGSGESSISHTERIVACIGHLVAAAQLRRSAPPDNRGPAQRAVSAPRGSRTRQARRRAEGRMS